MNKSRRTFVKNTLQLGTAGLVGSTPMWNIASAFGQQSKIKIGAIGVNGMGWADLTALLKHPDVTCTALCDVDENVLAKRTAELKEQGIKVKTYTDHQQLLKDKNVDAVVIGSPDHWHCLQMLDACKSGRPVYVEKPVGNSIYECEAMLAGADQYDSIVQVGQWQRSQKHFKDAVAFVHSGQLGKIRLVKAWAYQGWMKSIPVKPDGAVPQGVHYDRWLGPALKRPFNPNRFHFEFRWFWDYAGGLMTDWGVHMLDYALLGMKQSTPKSIAALGGKFAYPDDAAETPDTLTTLFEFDDFTIQWEHANGIDGGPYGRNHGVAFIGNKGTLVVNREGWEVIPEGDRMPAVPLKKREDDGLLLHTANFVEAIQKNDRKLLNTPIKAGADIAIFSQMGNIAYRTGKKIFWDAGKKQFDDEQANALIKPTYHNGYQLPVLSS